MPKSDRQAVIGQSVTRLEDRPLLTGRSCFIDDLDLPGTAHATILRSPHAHALITSIETGAAKAAPGVIDVFTAADLPKGTRIPMRMFPREGLERFLEPPLAEDRVRFSGEPVAVVVAESRYLAEDAADLIEVAYELLPVVIDGHAAIGGDAVTLFPETGTNLSTSFEVGDESAVDAVFADAHLVIEERLKVQRHAAVPMETRGVAAEVDRRTGELTVWGASKIVHINRDILARMLDRPRESVRLVELHVGGGFGARGEFYPEDFLIPFAAIRAGRPVSWTSDREEDLRTTNHSREQVHEIAIALDENGTLLGLRDRVTFNTGAYVRTHGTVVPSMTGALLPGPYRWQAYHAEIRHVLTNKTPAGTYRAPGRYEANFARERMIDIAAHRLGIDPAELRRRNLVSVKEMPYATGSSLLDDPIVYDSGDYPKLFEKGMARFDYDEMRNWRASPIPGLRRGVGLGFFVEKSAIGKWDYARVELGSDGRLVVHVGATSIGQGLETTMAQICADAIGLEYESVAAVHHGDTATVPDGMGSFGSRATVITGGAVHKAGLALRARILDYAADHLEASADDLEFSGDQVVVRGSPKRGVSLAEIAGAGRTLTALGEGREPGWVEEAYYEVDRMSFPYGLHCVGVEVDAETGGVSIERYMVAYDVGRAVNPMLIHGQIVGGAAQGAGGALLEELSYSPEGQLVAGSFMDYLMPTAGEAPVLDVLITEDAPSPLSPIGAKGAGEGGTAAAAAAIANAVSDAAGAEALELPLSPERVLSLVRDGSDRLGKPVSMEV